MPVSEHQIGVPMSIQQIQKPGTGMVTHVLRCGLCLWIENCWAHPPPSRGENVEHNLAQMCCALPAETCTRTTLQVSSNLSENYTEETLPSAHKTHWANNFHAGKLYINPYAPNLQIKGYSAISNSVNQNYSFPCHSSLHFLNSNISVSYRRLKEK